MRGIRAVAAALLMIVVMTVGVASPTLAAGHGRGNDDSTAVLLGVQAGGGVDGASCSGGCSETVNESFYGLMAFRNWCTGGWTSSTTTERPTCTVENVLQDWTWVPPGAQTPPGQDWDGFQVDAGWCYQVWWVSYLFGVWRQWFNRTGLSNLYVKVGNDATAYVEEQQYGSCP